MEKLKKLLTTSAPVLGNTVDENRRRCASNAAQPSCLLMARADLILVCALGNALYNDGADVWGDVCAADCIL